jgi:hypothetical protein
VIRGTVTERGSGRPLAGALVSLLEARSDERSAAVRQAVTNERGEYAIRAPGPGAYRLVTRRIGVSAAVSGPLALGESETIRHDVELDPFTSLPRVVVRDQSLCTTGRGQAERVAALWEEARTALAVIVASDAQEPLQRRLIRYQRVLAPFTFEITSETARSYDAQDGIPDALFKSLSGDSLSRVGYWLDQNRDMTFYAPDAHALLSEAFLRDHCLGVADGRGDREGMVGLTFQPVRGRPPAEIRGTLWLDAARFELRLVEFVWLNLPLELRNERIGGEVHFMRLPTGHWVVKRWSLTMPRPTIRQLRRMGALEGESLYSDGLAEEGGMIVVQGVVPFERPGLITGSVTQPNGRPLASARVRLVGTTFRAVADARGRFRFDSLPPGLYAIVAEHRDYDVFGLRAAEQEFVLVEGATRDIVLRALGEKEIADQLCPGRDWRRATLRVTLVNERTSQPMPGTRLRLRWLDVDVVVRGGLEGRVARDTDVDLTTDQNGIAMFCSVATGRTVTLGYPVDSTGLYPLHTFRLEREQNQIATVRASPP